MAFIRFGSESGAHSRGGSNPERGGEQNRVVKAKIHSRSDPFHSVPDRIKINGAPDPGTGVGILFCYLEAPGLNVPGQRHLLALGERQVHLAEGAEHFADDVVARVPVEAQHHEVKRDALWINTKEAAN